MEHIIADFALFGFGVVCGVYGVYRAVQTGKITPEHVACIRKAHHE
jgi:hypothetical protein